MDWQPIETAPKDGTHVLAWMPGYSFPHVVTWTAPVRVHEDGAMVGTEPCWAFDGWALQSDNPETHPTHWMPLPEPP